MEEQPHCFKGPDAYPALLVDCETLRDSGDIRIAFEGLELQATDVIEGMALLLAIYWTFNVQYSPKNKNTYCVLERMLGIDVSTARSPCAANVISALRKL